jgi:hypothetical protein
VNTSLEKLTDNEFGKNGGSISTCQAVFQADYVMSARMVNHETDILVTSDSDQAAILGNECVSVKSYKFKNCKKPTIEDCQIFVATRKTLDEVLLYLNLPKESEKIIPAKFPVFDCAIDCPRFRSLMAVCLGCDVSIHHVFSPLKIYNILDHETIKKSRKL